MAFDYELLMCSIDYGEIMCKSIVFRVMIIARQVNDS